MFYAGKGKSMKDSIRLTEDVPVRGSYDVIVAGGGVAGVAAALSVRRRGRRVLLLEKADILGGLATLGLVNLFVAMDNGRGKQVIFGMAEELLRTSIRYGYDNLNPNFVDGVNIDPEDKRRYATHFDPYIFALQLNKMCRDEGVDVLLDCLATKPVMEGNTCRGVVVETVSGREYIACRVLIDTTGSADMLRRSGVPTVESNRYCYFYPAKIDFDDCRKALERNSLLNLIKDIRVDPEGISGSGRKPRDVPMWNGTRIEDVNDYLTRMQLKTLEMIKDQDRNSRIIARMPLMPQFITICHIDGDATFTAKDVYRHFEDSVCAVNNFDVRDELYEVPYRCLYRTGWPNILTAGRCVAAEGEGWDVLRVIPPAILTGQAAGEAAVLALEEEKAVSDISIDLLQKRLEEGRVMIHFPDEWVPEDRSTSEAAVTETKS